MNVVLITFFLAEAPSSPFPPSLSPSLLTFTSRSKLTSRAENSTKPKSGLKSSRAT